MEKHEYADARVGTNLLLQFSIHCKGRNMTIFMGHVMTNITAAVCSIALFITVKSVMMVARSINGDNEFCSLDNLRNFWFGSYLNLWNACALCV